MPERDELDGGQLRPDRHRRLRVRDRPGDAEHALRGHGQRRRAVQEHGRGRELDAAQLPLLDLSQYTTVVIGPRAYETSAELRAANPRLFEWVRGGGTLVVQYGQFEMAQPGMMPFPVQYTRPAARVTRG